jgi:hypothetical protein
MKGGVQWRTRGEERDEGRRTVEDKRRREG